MTVVAGIGSVALIKEEDCGEAVFAGDDIQVPDFRIVLNNGTQVLVEVKAHHDAVGSDFKLSDSYVRKLQRYADLMKTGLYVAIFWEQLGMWTLNRMSDFVPGQTGEKWSIGISRAFAMSEMLLVGDYTIATVAPLRFRVHFDPAKSEPVPEEGGPATVSISRVELLSQDRILKGQDASIAWKLIWYGSWEDSEQEVVREGNFILRVDHLCVPSAWNEPEMKPGPNDVSPIGALSQLISNAYLSGAEQTIHTNTMDGVLAPGRMGQLIPKDFKSSALPLSRFYIKRNDRFSDDESAGARPNRASRRRMRAK